jgi:glycerophosphoryl diester phosphodiesterase
MWRLDLPAPPWIVGHRGVRGPVPENTVGSVLEAVAQGADMVELDLQLTADGRLVVHHDREVSASLGESVVVSRSSLAELRRSRPGWWSGGRRRSYRMPTVEEVLAAAPAGLPLNLELKRYDVPDDPSGMVTALAERIAGRRQILVSSFDHRLLLAVRERLPDLPLAPLGGRRADWTGLVELAERLDAFSIHVHRQLALTLGAEGRLGEPESRTRPILAYTVNRPATARRLSGLGLSGFFSDRPGALRAKLAAGP